MAELITRTDVDDDTCLDSALSPNLGDIILKVWRASVEPILKFKAEPLPSTFKLHERTKMALVHQVQ
jgi:hypothetical protein